MRYVYIIGGSLVGLVILVAIAGAMLPRDHVASMRTTIPAPQDSVWAALTDVAAYPSWRGGVTRVDILSKTPLSWREHTSQGPMTLAVETFDPPRRMVGRVMDTDQPWGGTWEYALASDGPNATTVTVTERGWVSNPIFRFVSKYVMGHYSTLDSYLRALGRKFGSDAAPIRV
jgi:uncharacterized protein YndB with AHSA1/START domain